MTRKIELPEFLFQFLVEPIFAAMDKVSGRLITADSVELDMYLEVLERIYAAFPERDQTEDQRRWQEIQSLSNQGPGTTENL